MKITIIGAGNVGYHLSQRLKEVGHTIVQVFSRRTDKVLRVSKIVGASPIDNLISVNDKADLYILAVKDDAIGLVAEKLAKKLSKDAWVVHTSGATPSTVLAPHFENYGIFYPLQTFSIARMPDFLSIPIIVDAKNPKMQEKLLALANTVSAKTYELNDDQRAKLHVNAVFVNNFTNHLYAIAEDILKKEELPMEILLPLIKETAAKIQHQSAARMQTGPATRGDDATIERHLEYLNKFPEYKEVYELMTKSIQDGRK